MYIHTIGILLTNKKRQTAETTMWVNFENIMKGERSPAQINTD